MSEKIIGYALSLCGVAIILGTGVNIFQVATNKVAPVNIFEFSGVKINTNDLINEQVQTTEDGIGAEIEIVPGNILTETSNLFAHLILVGFLASVGYKIASLGVLMLRPIVVKLNQKNNGTQETA